MNAAAQYPRVSVGFVLTVVERDSEFVGQVIMAMDQEERVIWESLPDETPTLAYQMAEDRLAAMFDWQMPSGSD